MRQTPLVKTAVVRDVPSTYAHCIRSDRGASIDVGLAREQHARYCEALTRYGVEIVRVGADERFPDCCFVEDPVLVIEDVLVVPQAGAPSRRGEAEALRQVLEPGRTVVEIGDLATLDGGDVLCVDGTLFVGVGGRSNSAAIDRLTEAVTPRGYNVVAVELRDTLHLKSVCAYLGSGAVVWSPGHFDPTCFATYEMVDIPREDAYSVNCLALNGVVLVADGYPNTRKRIEALGFETDAIPVTEFRKGDGGLSCLSIRVEETNTDRNQTVTGGV